MKNIFIMSCMFYLISFMLLILFKKEVEPHYSYLIEKQKEVLKMSSRNQDLRFLQTPEYAGVPVPGTSDD